jgi:hypothetical protein
MRNGGVDEDRGNAILATLPLRDVAAIELPLVRERRVAVAASAGRAPQRVPPRPAPLRLGSSSGARVGASCGELIGSVSDSDR